MSTLVDESSEGLVSTELVQSFVCPTCGGVTLVLGGKALCPIACTHLTVVFGEGGPVAHARLASQPFPAVITPMSGDCLGVACIDGREWIGVLRAQELFTHSEGYKELEGGALAPPKPERPEALVEKVDTLKVNIEELCGQWFRLFQLAPVHYLVLDKLWQSLGGTPLSIDVLQRASGEFQIRACRGSFGAAVVSVDQISAEWFQLTWKKGDRSDQEALRHLCGQYPRGVASPPIRVVTMDSRYARLYGRFMQAPTMVQLCEYALGTQKPVVTQPYFVSLELTHPRLKVSARTLTQLRVEGNVLRRSYPTFNTARPGSSNFHEWTQFTPFDISKRLFIHPVRMELETGAVVVYCPSRSYLIIYPIDETST